MKKIILLLFIITLTSCSFGDKSTDSQSKSKTKNSHSNKKNQKDKDEKDEVIINVEATEIYAGDAISVFKTTTILQADLESAVTSKASGIVLQINAEVGDKVKAGDVLAVLESDVQQLRLKSAKANYQKVLNNYQRAQSLLKKGLANKESVDNLKFETQSLKTSLQQAQLDLEFTQIKAPIAGIITKRSIKKGNLIQLNTAVYEIVDFHSLQAVINVPEDKWNLFSTGLSVNFKFSSLPQTLKGEILRIEPYVDSATGTFKVVIAINDAIKYKLRPGLFGKTEIIIDQHKNTLLVSKNAVIREDDNAFVYAINADNTVSKKDVQLGYEMDDAYEILSGIELNTKVVTTGKNNLAEGSHVEVIE